MRLKTALWVHAYIRRCMAAGAFAAVVRHGDDDAGAVLIKVNRLDGSCLLYLPAPAGLAGVEEERRWSAIPPGRADTEERVEAVLARELEFDTDHWVVEVEDREGRHFLNDCLEEP